MAGVQTIMPKLTHRRSPSCCPVCRSLTCRLRSHRNYGRRFNTELSQQQVLQARIQDSPSYGIHNEKTNPFANYPIVMTREMESIYSQLFRRWDYRFQGLERHLFPFSRYGAMLKAAPYDKALLTGFLSVVATQISIARQATIDRFALGLQLAVVKAQQQALQEDGCATDARIATALCILANSVHNNHTVNVGTDLATIEHIASQRGGILYLGMDGVLADNFMYIDHLGAIVQNILPRYMLPQPYLTSVHAPESRATYRDVYHLGLLSHETMCAATMFDILLQIYDNAVQGSCEPSNARYFAYLANAVECQLAVANAKHHDTSTLDDCLILALVVFNHTMFRTSRCLAPPVLLFERRFWTCFRAMQEQEFFLRHDLVDLECYLACVGAITTLRRPGSATDQTIEVLVKLRTSEASQITDFDALCRIMDKYGWSRKVCFNLYRCIWSDSFSYCPSQEDMRGSLLG